MVAKAFAARRAETLTLEALAEHLARHDDSHLARIGTLRGT